MRQPMPGSATICPPHRPTVLASCTAPLRQEMEAGPSMFQPAVNRRSVQLADAKLWQTQPELAALPAGERLYMRALASPMRR